MKVTLLAQTAFEAWPEDVPWHPSESMGERGWWSGEHLAEFAGRACYQSWSKPNPKTATNQGYLDNIISVGHFSVLEHANVTFYIEGVSRSLSHEFIRHRHFSYSQVSQRYVDESDTEFVVPPLLDDEGLQAHDTFQSAMQSVRHHYQELVADLSRQFPGTSRKEIRQAARAVLPNATETKFVVTGNFRAWWEFLLLRPTEAADTEIRALAVEILRQLQAVAPNVFNHFEIYQLEDGTEAAQLKEGTDA